MCTKMWRTMRPKELISVPRARQCKAPACDAACVAGRRLLRVYTGLAQRGEHLLEGLLLGQAPTQWAHYPEDDAIDVKNGYQWFYHSHSPEDRSGNAEHGHIHLFGQRKLWSRRLRSRRELAFAELAGETERQAGTSHLLGIGFNAKGLPISLFTVNGWVTGDSMLTAETTAELLGHMVLDTGNANVDAVVKSLVCLFRAEIWDLLIRRDTTLFGFKCADVLSNRSLEVLSMFPIDVDSKLVW